MKTIVAHTFWLALVAAGCSKKSDAPAPAPTAAKDPAPAANDKAPAPAPTPAPPKGKDPEAAKKMISAGAVILDVRTTDEFAEDHLGEAVNIPIDDMGTRIAEVATLTGNDKAKPIVVYCASGERAGRAKSQLDAAGYTNVVNGGGLDDLH